jgi:NADH-quinone oxidoreductase subunit M
MGFVMLGIATLTTFGINAASSAWWRTASSPGMLFFRRRFVQERYGTREMSRLGGCSPRRPNRLASRVLRMASLGLPGSPGFWGEFPAAVAYDPASVRGGSRRHAHGRSASTW